MQALIGGLIIEASNEEPSTLSLSFEMRSWMGHFDAEPLTGTYSLDWYPTSGTSRCTQSWYLLPLYSLVVPSMFGTK